MSEKPAELVGISTDIWNDFKRIYLLINPKDSSEAYREHATFLINSFLADLADKWESEFPYQTLPTANHDGWIVCYCEKGKEPRVTDAHPRPFAKNRKYNADRLRTSLNRKWHKADKETEAIIREKGGLIV